jgi:hypothetical protein
MNTIQPPAVADENIPGVEFDKNGKPTGITVEEWFDRLDGKLIEHFGEEYRTLANERRARWNQKSCRKFDRL